MHGSSPWRPSDAGKVERAVSTTTEPRSRERDLPNPDDEREVDLGRHWHSLVHRWWLPVAGLIVGALIAYLVTIGGSQVYTAKSTIYLGQPLSPVGSVQLQSQATNPSTVGQVIHSEAALRQAARAAGIPVRKLRGHVTSRPVAGALTKLGQTPLVLISVTGKTPRQTQVAANTLAQIVIHQTSSYVNKLIASLQAQIDGYTQSLNVIDRSLSSNGLSGTGQARRVDPARPDRRSAHDREAAARRRAGSRARPADHVRGGDQDDRAQQAQLGDRRRSDRPAHRHRRRAPLGAGGQDRPPPRLTRRNARRQAGCRRRACARRGER